MIAKWLLLASFPTLTGCITEMDKEDAGPGCPQADLRGLPSPDLAPPAAKCAAAAGLAGTNLLCVDFDKVTQLSDPALNGWNFATSMSGTCTGWTIANNKLQVASYGTLANGICGFTLPALSAADYQKYNSFTLSIIHRVDISETVNQKVQVMMGADDPLTRLVTQWTGKGARQFSTMSMAKADLPNGGTSTYQPLLKIASTNTAGGGFQGWLIESIAVNASP